MLVQTFQPDARPIAYAARHDVPRFLAEELDRRRDLGYPPFRHLVRIVVTGPDPDPALRALEEVRAGIGDAELLGPAPLVRLRGRHRAQLVAKTERPRGVAAQAARLLAAAAPAMRRAGLTAVVDVDPQSPLTVAPLAVKRPHAEEILGEWGIRDVTPPSQRERERLGRPRRQSARRQAAPAASANFRPETDTYLASLGGPLPYMQRLRQIEDADRASTSSGSRRPTRNAPGPAGAPSPSAGTSARSTS